MVENHLAPDAARSPEKADSTPRVVTKASSKDYDLPENSQDEMSRRLDEAAAETFPSSDPVSVKITK